MTFVQYSGTASMRFFPRGWPQTIVVIVICVMSFVCFEFGCEKALQNKTDKKPEPKDEVNKLKNMIAKKGVELEEASTLCIVMVPFFCFLHLVPLSPVNINP